MLISIDKKNYNTIDTYDCHNDKYFLLLYNKKRLFIVFSKKTSEFIYS